MLVHDMCAICGEIFITNNIAALLCGHIFHADCIQEWFKHTETPTCPNCRAYTATNQVVRRLFFSTTDDTTLIDELMKTLSEKKHAFSRARAESRGLKNDYENLESKVARTGTRRKISASGENSLLDGQNDIQTKQLDEAKNLEKKLKAKLRGEQKQLRKLRKKKRDFEARIESMEEQTRVSKEKENDLEKLVKSMEEQLKIYKNKESDFGEPVKSLKEIPQIPEGEKINSRTVEAEEFL